MNDHLASESCPDSVQTKALASAILLRNCSQRVETSLLVRRAYRTQMRAQAIKWRQSPGNAAAPAR